MTIPVVLVGHGGFPQGVRDAVEMILGPQPMVGVVSLPPNGSTEELGETVRAEIDRLGGADGALVLADLMGGSPANAVGLLALRDPGIQLVSGCNLAMALEVLTSIEDTAPGLAGIAVNAGRDGVIDVAAQLRQAAGQTGG